MKKIIFTACILSITTLISTNTEAVVVDQDEKKATFDIVDNPNGTLLIEADDLNFGNHTIIPGEIKARTKDDSSIKITEFSGSRPGWLLRVKMSEFSDSSSNTINGVQLFYPKVTPTTTTGGDAPINSPTTFEESNSFLDSLKGTIVYDNETFVNLAQADSGKGFGVWKLPYNNDTSLGADNRIQLKIPEGQRVGSYSATLTYEAVSGP